MDAEKVKQVLTPLLKEILAEQTKAQEAYFNTRINDIALQIGKLETRFTTLESIMANTKKPVKTKPAKAEKAASGPVAEGEELKAVVAAAETAKPEGNFKNLYNWFLTKYKEDEGFRKRFTSAAHAAVLAADPEVQAKDVVKKNFIVSSKKMYSLIRSDSPDTLKAITAEYEAAKAATNNNKATQEEKEPVTPK